MEEILKIAGIAITGVILASATKAIKPEFVIYIVISTVVILLFFIIDKLVYVFSFLEEVYGNLTYGKTFFSILIKVLAVAYLTDFVSSICKDAGETAISIKVELSGKVIIFYISIPILVSILDLVNSII